MKGTTYIKGKQRMWARSRGMKLQGSQGNRGEKNYVMDLKENFFEDPMDEHRKEIEAGDGGEFKDSGKQVAKAKALHSSSVLCINLFHYWSRKKELNKLCHALGLCNKGSISGRKLYFEKKLSILETKGNTPNLDVVIENTDKTQYKAYGIESKFSEPFSKREDKKSHSESLSSYLQDTSIPRVKAKIR